MDKTSVEFAVAMMDFSQPSFGRNHTFSKDLDFNVSKQQNIPTVVNRYIPDKTVQIFYTVNLAVICTAICLFGISANIINIAVFFRQGFKETVNITLFALAVSDLGSLVALLWMGICVNPFFQYADTPLLTVEVQNITGGWIHVLFCRITGWLTAFITVERCLCVIFPLKIKSILTTTRVKMIVVATFLLIIAGKAPIFYSTNLGWKFVPERNRTMLGLVYTDNWAQLMKVSVIISGVVSTLGFSTLILISTILLVINLRGKTKWRRKTIASSEKGLETARRDQKIIRMVIIIASIFIICLLPPSLITIPMGIDSKFSVMGKYGNIIMVIVTFGMILEAINSSVNIFVYYNMSSNYRVILKSMFSKRHRS